MSGLVYQNYNNKCQGWVNPSNISFGPQITALSGYQSPAGSSTVVAINGNNFYSYSTISFGTFNPTVYFINSNLLQFYVPNTLSSGTFPVQVFNDSVGSNIVDYTIDNASGYWLLNSNGSISNTNTSGVTVSWLSRGAPVYLDNSSDTYNSITPYIVPNNVNWIICDGNGNDTFIQLPTGTVYIGREIMFKSYNMNIISNSINIVSLSGIALTNSITTSGKWVTLVCLQNLNWEIMQEGGP